MTTIEKNKKWKFIYGLTFQLFVYLFSELFEFDNVFIIIAINVILYTLPYYVTVYLIRLNDVTLKKICIFDLIYYLIPTIFICPIYESIAVIITKTANESNGLFSFVNIIIYIIIYLFYILIYKLNLDKKRSIKK